MQNGKFLQLAKEFGKDEVRDTMTNLIIRLTRPPSYFELYAELCIRKGWDTTKTEAAGAETG